MLMLIQSPASAPEFPWGVAWGVLTAVAALAMSYLHLWMTDRNRKLYAPLQPLYDDKGNPCWATKRDLDALGAKVSTVQTDVGHTDDRVEANKNEIALIRQAQMFTHQEMMDKLSDAVGTLKAVVAKMAEVSENQRAQAEQLRTILNRKEGA